MTPAHSIAVVCDHAYGSHEEHLWHHLERIDHLVRAHTVLWHATLAATKPAEHWGMALVSDAEVAGYLETPFRPPHRLPADLAERLAPYRRRAADAEYAIAARCEATPPAVDLRLDRLAASFRLEPIDRDVLLVCLLAEVDERYRRLFGYLSDDASQRRPSVGLIGAILDPAHEGGEGAAPRTVGAFAGDGALSS